MRRRGLLLTDLVEPSQVSSVKRNLTDGVTDFDVTPAASFSFVGGGVEVPGSSDGAEQHLLPVSVSQCLTADLGAIN